VPPMPSAPAKARESGASAMSSAPSQSEDQEARKDKAFIVWKTRH